MLLKLPWEKNIEENKETLERKRDGKWWNFLRKQNDLKLISFEHEKKLGHVSSFSLNQYKILTNK